MYTEKEVYLSSMFDWYASKVKDRPSVLKIRVRNNDETVSTK